MKWYWWRFNANGFYIGMLTGVAGAMIFSRLFTGIEFLYYFPVLFVLSVAGSFIGTYTAPATNTETLKTFYRTVRPWGFWKPIQELVQKEDPSFEPNRRFKLDMFNVVLGIIGQLCMTVLPMYVVLSMHLPLIITIIIMLVIIFILKKTWWNKLED